MGSNITKYTKEIEDEIIERVGNGEPLRVICRDKGIHYSTVYDWLKEYTTFNQRFARARDDGYDEIACRLRETARGNGESTGDIQRDKLIIETDLKLLSKWSNKYSERMRTEVTGTGDNGEITIKHIAISLVKPQSDSTS